jgi:hypothetical protein
MTTKNLSILANYNASPAQVNGPQTRSNKAPLPPRMKPQTSHSSFADTSNVSKRGTRIGNDVNLSEVENDYSPLNQEEGKMIQRSAQNQWENEHTENRRLSGKT